MGFLVLIVPLAAVADIGHVPLGVGFDVGRMGWSNRLAYLLHESVGVAFAKDVFVPNPSINDRLIVRNFDAFDSTTLSAGTNLISKLNPSVVWKFGKVGDSIDRTPSIAIFDDFARRLAMVIDVELKPFALGKVDSIAGWRRQPCLYSFFLRDLSRGLATAASRHVSSFDIFGSGKLLIVNLLNRPCEPSDESSSNSADRSGRLIWMLGNNDPGVLERRDIESLTAYLYGGIIGVAVLSFAFWFTR